MKKGVIVFHQDHQKPQQGPGKQSGEKIFEFFFKMPHFGVLLIFEQRRGPQTSGGPG